MRIEKGQPGYLKAQKVKYLIWALGEFIVVVGLVVLGYIQTGSKLNLFTVAAVVCCLPAAKMLVEFITMAPHKSIEPEKAAEIREKGSLLTQVYDLIITGDVAGVEAALHDVMSVLCDQMGFASAPITRS